jgi:hypothetical protein
MDGTCEECPRKQWAGKCNVESSVAAKAKLVSVHEYHPVESARKTFLKDEHIVKERRMDFVADAIDAYADEKYLPHHRRCTIVKNAVSASWPSLGLIVLPASPILQTRSSTRPTSHTHVSNSFQATCLWGCALESEVC